MKNQKKIRLSRFLADCGIGSRRKCGDLVKEGKVAVNGSIVNDLSVNVSDEDSVTLDGRSVERERKVVLALNKPRGFLSTAKDDFKRKTVLHLTRDYNMRLYPAGRLDLDSRGLIILTNDGDIAYRITHPKYNVPKTYEVVLGRTITDSDMARMHKGIMVEKKIFKPDRLEKTRSSKDGFPLLVMIHEGRKRIIRRAFKKMNYNVTDLKRVMIGKYRLGSLPEGQYKELGKNEINMLMMIK